MPLDLALQGHGLTVEWTLVIRILPAALLIGGLILERRRTR
jgi:hypothetical protein